MGRRNKVRPAPNKFATDKLKEIAGSWSVSYNFIDLDGDFAWPDKGEVEFQELATFLARLSLLKFEECTALVRSSQRPAHGPITGGINLLAETRLEHLIKTVPGMEELVFDGEITRFSYCYGDNQTERIYGIRVGSVVYLLWWDPSHAVVGAVRGTPSTPCNQRNNCHHVQRS